jgi:hypothetical protein
MKRGAAARNQPPAPFSAVLLYSPPFCVSPANSTFFLVRWGLCTIAAVCRRRQNAFDAEEAQNVRSAYAHWIGQEVVLQVAEADLRVPLRGTVIGESGDSVRFRVGDGFDIDIFKNMILAVEQAECENVIG